MKFDELSNKVIGCTIEAHRALGPGLLKSTYEQRLAHELRLNSIHATQLLIYMKLSNIKKGLLINFNVKILKKGIKRFVL